jgi:hypothetical protein
VFVRYLTALSVSWAAASIDRLITEERHGKDVARNVQFGTYRPVI